MHATVFYPHARLNNDVTEAITLCSRRTLPALPDVGSKTNCGHIFIRHQDNAA